MLRNQPKLKLMPNCSGNVIVFFVHCTFLRHGLLIIETTEPEQPMQMKNAKILDCHRRRILPGTGITLQPTPTAGERITKGRYIPPAHDPSQSGRQVRLDAGTPGQLA